MFISLIALTVLASCSREEKPTEKKSEAPAPAPQTPAAPSSGGAKTTPAPTAADAASALKAALASPAKKTAAKTAMMLLTNALQQYMLEYDHLPESASASKGVDCMTDTGNEEGVMAILKGRDKLKNPKGFDFMADLKNAKAEGGKHLDGITTEGEMVAFYDPWGQPYQISLDLDGDGKLTDPSAGKSTNGALEISKKVIVWSYGPDGKPDTWEDNLCSWK
ncbi:MAG TPA: hypothetical protein VG796_25255 [Verrucomicrobiales bacterium]|nr:hypothetical protein [Verrucomicrobiales bacterium]